MSALLAVIPKSALALAVAVLTALLVMQTLVAERSAKQLAELRTQVATATANASERERAKEQEWRARQQETLHAYQLVAQQMLADRAAADAAAGGLHAAARAHAARRCTGPGAAPVAGSDPTQESPDFLLSELFALADRRAGELAQEADARLNGWNKCAAEYHAIR